MIIGLVSDTHGFYDSRLDEVFRGAAAIVHAGDVGGQDVLDRLRRIAPVHAVRGNVDPPVAGWPLTLTLKLGGVTLHALHIPPAPQRDLKRWAVPRSSDEVPKAASRPLGAIEPGADVVVFGHSHEPSLLILGGVLWVNPGSAGRKRFSLPRTCALLNVSEGAVSAEIVSLEPCAQELPGKVQWRSRERVR